MYTEESKVLPFKPNATAHKANVDVLRVLAAALQESTPTDAPASKPEHHQKVKGDWNVQVTTADATSQKICGNNNVQISGAHLLVRVNVRVNRQ
ncbi:hypothetical protein CAL26_05865 [Bordetella genomosp. 9]|uniref:Uncharacterized protein n=1 Tax=Bordetella genomosp. 9 TaxID=1416803 RepID=A0A261RP48_9BORD|nr:hypothetical protein [Bordetella genomosp. 9]OZI26838.1 hypothetical protein CAL26_05865 [Bordetella genomosp. 9]